MKLLVLLSVFIVLFTQNDAVRCVNYARSLYFNIFQLLEAKKNISMLQADIDFERCSISFTVMNPVLYFIIDFMQSLLRVPNVNTDILINTVVDLASDNSTINSISVTKTFSFTCNDSDGCERQFFLDHIDWLMKEEHIELDAKLRQILIVEGENDGQCIRQIRNSTENCYGNGCIRQRDIESNRNVRNCVGGDDFLIDVRFLTKISVSTNGTGTKDNKYSLEITESILLYSYGCKFDFCNNEQIENNVIEVIKNVFKNTPMYQVLKKKFQQQTTTSIISSTKKLTTSKAPKASTSKRTTKKQKTSTSTNNPTTDHLNNASILHYISIDIFILHIFFLLLK